MIRYDVQVLGATGMLGRAVVREARAAGLTICDERVELEIFNLQHLRASTVINCAGIVKQNLDALPSQVIAANSYAPTRIAEICSIHSARLIHVSTDCVFGTGFASGRGGPSWQTEETPPTPNDLYGRSKLAGEVYYTPHLTVRTSFVGFGRYGLISQLLAGPVTASRYFYWSGHTVDVVATCLIRLVRRDTITGLLHIPGAALTRLELSQKLARYLELPDSRVIESNYLYTDRTLGSVRWHKLGLEAFGTFDEELRAMVKP